ncbi:MAG: hypothetical protein K2Q18_15815, partial [Bdellovibrionales bacterium]|nr:hypothetical protein [Bdellovibrionales bacterium]
SFFLTAITNVVAADLKTNYLTFAISNRNVDILHNETSDDTRFVSLNKNISIPTFSLSIGAEKELLADQVISFTVGGGVGGMFGRSKGDIPTRNLQYRDKASGYSFSALGSLNGNFTIYKMRSQVFSGFHFLKSNSKFKLAYGPMNAASPAINIDYAEDGTQSFITAGLRFFDVKTELFSIIAIEYELTSSFNTSVDSSKIDKTKIGVTNPSKVEHNPYVVTLGFGMTF